MNTIQQTEKTPFDMTQYLDSEEAIAEYLTQVLEEGDTDELIRAIGHIAKAMTPITDNMDVFAEKFENVDLHGKKITAKRSPKPNLMTARSSPAILARPFFPPANLPNAVSKTVI
jgi:hypothetical protein